MMKKYVNISLFFLLVYYSSSVIAQNVSVKLLSSSGDQIYRTEKDSILRSSIENSSDENIDGTYFISVYNDLKYNVISDSFQVAVAKKDKYNFDFNLNKLGPGFFDFNCSYKYGKNNRIAKFRIGIDPEKVIVQKDSSADLANFWLKARADLSQVNPDFKLIPQPDLSNEKREVYLVEMYSLDTVLIRGWYAIPRFGGKYPVIVRFPGFSGSLEPSNFFNLDGFAEFLLNTRGHGNSKDDINPGFGSPGYYGYGIQDKEKFIYRGAYMDCIRAIDFVCSRPEIDSTNIALEGVSQGGRLAYVTAALDNKRIKVCVSNIPGFCDFPELRVIEPDVDNYFLNSAYPEYQVTLDQIYSTLSYIDMINLGDAIKCPVLLGMGLMDEEHPARTVIAAYNVVNSEKELLVFPAAAHWVPDEFLTYELQWIRTKIGIADTIKPSKPLNLKAQPSSNSVKLTWSKSKDVYGIVGYKIFQDSLLVEFTKSNLCTIFNLESGKTYQFYINAIDVNGNESERSEIEISTLNVLSNKQLANEVMIFPNPFSESLYVPNNKGIGLFEIYDILGNRVMKIQNPIGSTLLNTSNLNRGVYFAHLYFDQNQKIICKIIKV
jgi:cephalosporin-C deacetylase-like acetyl esterase